MLGFAFRYRLSGLPATIQTFPLGNWEPLTRGDMLAVENGAVALGATGDRALLGVATESRDGAAGETLVRVIVDADAVYGVRDPRIRLKGDALGLTGLSGGQGVGAGGNADFVVDVDSSADEETLVRIDGGRRRETPGWAEPRAPLTGGDLNAAIARAVVRYHAAQLGRGPTKARAFHRDDVVVVVLEDVMTTAERNLVAAGRRDAVLHTRRAFQETMRPYLRSTIERLTGCRVRAFMSANELEPDMASEVFVLDRPVPSEHELPAAGGAT